MLDNTRHLAVNGQRASKAWKRPRRPSRRRFRNGQRVAVLRALIAASLYLDGNVETLAEAAACCGASSGYAWAAAILVQARDAAALKDALAGRVSLFAAASERRRIAALPNAGWAKYSMLRSA
jgi:hypothetical protein